MMKEPPTFCRVNSVPRFGEISPLWLFLKICLENVRGILHYGANLGRICNAARESFIVVHGQILKISWPSGHTDRVNYSALYLL